MLATTRAAAPRSGRVCGPPSSPPVAVAAGCGGVGVAGVVAAGGRLAGGEAGAVAAGVGVAWGVTGAGAVGATAAVEGADPVPLDEGCVLVVPELPAVSLPTASGR